MSPSFRNGGFYGFLAVFGWTLVRQLVAERPNALKILDTDGNADALTLRRVGSGTELVVSTSATVTMSPSAWAARGLLQQKIMSDLIGRMRVIALVPRSDQVQRNLLREEFGKSVRFVETAAALERELGRAERRFVVVLGHVEDNSFVLRNSAGEVVLNTEILAVRDIVDANRSVSLLMGCRVACTPSLSGPTHIIDAIETVNAIKLGADLRTPLEFVEALAQRTGPMHIERDLMGRMRVVSAAHSTKTEIAVRTGAPIVRAIIPQTLSPPVTFSNVIENMASAALMIVFMIGASWLSLLIIGMTPARAWREGTELYALVSGRTEDKIGQLTRTELTVLYAVTPATYILAIFPLFALALFLFATGMTALIFGAFINLMGLGDSRQFNETEEKHINMLPKWVNAAMPAAFLFLVVAFSSIFIVELLGRSRWGLTESEFYWLVFSIFSLLLVGALKRLPKLLYAFDCTVGILGLPTLLCWGIVRYVIVLPLHWLGSRVQRIWPWASN